MTDDAPVLLALDGITKRFGRVVANEDVSFDLRAGEIHALVGENGAGKTTLMRILYGMYHADAGTIRFEGEPTVFRNPTDAIKHGIGMVHQHFMLVPSFTVAENLTLGAEPRRGGLFDHAAASAAVRETMDRLAVTIDPDAIVGDLSVATQQKIEIAKVLYRGARVIILDEPTAVLTPQETTELFALLRRLADDGSSIIFISHKLREVFALADRVTVLRGGKTIVSRDVAETTLEDTVAAMTGRSDVNLGRIIRNESDDATIALTVDGLSTATQSHDSALSDVTFAVRAGEIVGVAGVEGNGQSVLAETLIGVVPATSGSISLGGADVTALGVAARRDKGFSYVPEDRHREGLPMGGSVLEGMSAGRIRARRGLGALGNTFRPSLRRWAGEQVDDYAIKTPGLDAHCGQLSGGNQQKVVIARELDAEPEVLVLAQPTRGVDLGAIEFMYGKVAEATERGCAVVLISADLDEIFRLADRIVVMYGGRIVADEPAATATRERIGMFMAGIDADAAQKSTAKKGAA